MTQLEFDNLYWASKDPKLAALPNLPITTTGDDPLAGRKTAGIQLATQGYLVDTQTMIWGWDPYLVMQLRQEFGLTSVNGLLNAGEIKVSLDPADYPAFAPPAPTPTPDQGTSLVGASQGFDLQGIEYFGGVRGNLPLTDGQLYTGDPRGNFIYHFKKTPFGGSQWFTKA